MRKKAFFLMPSVNLDDTNVTCIYKRYISNNRSQLKEGDILGPFFNPATFRLYKLNAGHNHV